MKKALAAMGALVLAFALLGAGPAFAAKKVTKAEKLERTNELMAMSMKKFLKVADTPDKKKGRVDKTLEWDYDGCTGKAWIPIPYQGTFHDACRRHDFAFRNYGSVNKLDPVEPRRLKANNVFSADMYKRCAEISGAKGTACRKAANQYFGVVNGLKQGATAFYSKSCDDGYLCGYDDNNLKGWRVQFSANSKNLKNFAGGDLDNNIKSVWNRSNVKWRVFKDPNYKGSTVCVKKNEKLTLKAGVLRDEVSSLKKNC